MDREIKRYLIGLKLISHLDRRINKVLEVFGSPDKVWHASVRELSESLSISKELAQEIAGQRQRIDLNEELKRLKDFDGELLSVFDTSYPQLLKEISSTPVFFVQGSLVKTYDYGVAIVGSRRASAYGKEFAFRLARQLSDLGVTVVSGVARGIDSAAHSGALQGAGGTIGVLGCGLDVIYPPENRQLYAEISRNGSLISEYALGAPPLPFNFPARNRIISGLSQGVVIVEASERSGALITADFALDQGRDVMVVPGNIRSSVSQGCHKLIKQGAYLIDSVDDVLDILDIKHKIGRTPGNAKDKPKLDISSEEQIILDYLGWEPKQVDQIVQAVDLNVSRVSTLLTILELKGIVKQDFGSNYLRIQ